ncbi:MAG: TolC family protein [Bacteroidetes bacterium]|nr:TolC family protein [Bacteroidota bacterium]MBI3483309.1 TolC family protein [Bacteroidota bacterium]
MKRIFIINMLILTFAFADAQTNSELKSLINKSFNYFPRIQELQKASEVSAIRVQQAWSNYQPVLSGVGSFNYVNPISQANFGAGEIKFQPNNNYNFNLAVTQPIWDFGKTNAQIAKAKTDLLSANTNIEQAKAQVAAQVASVYYSMIYLKKAVAVEDSILSFLTENKKIIESRIKRGDALQIDLTNIQSNIDLEENRKVDFVNSLQKQKALMEYTSGSSVEPTITDFDFPKFTEGLAEDYAKQNNFDLRLATQRTLGSEMDLKYAQNSRFPLLTFVGGTGYRNGYQPNINPLIFNYALGVNLSVPIYSQGKTSQNIRIAQSNLQANQLASKTAENNLRRDLAQVQADLSSNEERIKNSGGQVNYAREALTLAQSRYKQGVATHLDLLNASSNLERILLNQIQFQYQLCVARIEQARLLGWEYWGE